MTRLQELFTATDLLTRADRAEARQENVAAACQARFAVQAAYYMAEARKVEAWMATADRDIAESRHEAALAVLASAITTYLAFDPYTKGRLQMRRADVKRWGRATSGSAAGVRAWKLMQVRWSNMLDHHAMALEPVG